MKNIYMAGLPDSVWSSFTLALFDGESNPNKTTDASLSQEMRTYYSDYLIDNAEPELKHDQFGQKRPIPKNGGKTINFRKYDPLPKLMKPLEEGITPDGQQLSMSDLEAKVHQYGGYVTLTDMLLLTAVDNNLVEATALLGSQAGRTGDTVTREVINGGTNVQYGADAVSARYLLVGGESSGNHILNVDCIRRAVRTLKHANTKPLDGGFYVAIINPDVSYDIRNDPKWESVKTYDPGDWYDGEIGKIDNVRFVETTEAKIFHAEDLSAESRNLTVSAAVNNADTVSVKETLSSEDIAQIVGRMVIVGGKNLKVTSATSSSITLESTVTASENDVIYPGEAGAKGRDVYSTLVLGANAYGVTEISGGGLEHIVHQLGSGGVSDPLNQRATCGWKMTKAAIRLVESYMVRIETSSTFESGAN